ncbi:MAG: ATP-binding protein [Deltaproteobacteria bacterium]|nr:ATP-binding protein [Deltaproteobacteria bacterium]
MQNPFKYGQIVTGSDFCPRPELIRQLEEHIKSGQNVVVYGERRVGKSSAVYQAAINSKPRIPLLIDFMGIKSIDALIKRILKALIAQKDKQGMMTSILKKFAAIRPTLSLDPVTSMSTFSFDASVEIKAESISEVIDLIKDLYGDKKVVVIMDEFQDILDLPGSREALAILRSVIQYQTNIPYIFVGSIRHKMSAIFIDSDSPFFKSAIPVEIEPIPADEFGVFIEKKFTEGKRKIRRERIDRLFEIAGNIPGDVQQLCEALWAVTKEKESIDAEEIKSALELIFSRERSAYENYVRLITGMQMKSLLAIAGRGGKSIFSNEFMKAAGFTNASSLKRCINRLTDLNLLFDYKGEYRFVNPFFRAWLIAGLS